MTTTFAIEAPRRFQLSAAVDFYKGFVPGSGMAAAAVDHFTLAFRLDRTFQPVAAAMRQQGRTVLVEVAGTDDEAAVRAQLGRILGLEADGEAWLEVGRRDRVVGALQAEFPGFFTAAKPSPYDAAVWSVIAPRMPIARAAAVKTAIARELGDAVEVAARVHHVFPAPAALARLERFEGLADEKVARLRGVAVAALAGRLEADRLRAMGERAALAELQTLRGVGPWSASHIYYRGAAPTDALPTAEPRVLHGFGSAYGIDAPTEAQYRRAAEAWSPYRMWVCVLLARHLARAGGWHARGLREERARAGRELARRTRGASAAV